MKKNLPKALMIFGLILSLALISTGGYYLYLNLSEKSEAQSVDPNIGVYHELEKIDLRNGEGEEAVEGKKVEVHYEGRIPDGTVFDSSYENDQTFELTLGEGQVIEGWEEGLIGMKEGGKRRLNIPSSLGYKETGQGNIIQPNYDLVFEVELISVSEPEEIPVGEQGENLEEKVTEESPELEVDTTAE